MSNYLHVNQIDWCNLIYLKNLLATVMQSAISSSKNMSDIDDKKVFETIPMRDYRHDASRGENILGEQIIIIQQNLDQGI